MRMYSVKNNSGKLIERSEIEDKYKWNLNNIYNSIEDWEKDFNFLKSNMEKYKEFEGKLLKSAKIFKDCLLFDDTVGIKLGHLYLFAMLNKDLDLGNNNNQELIKRIVVLASDLESASAFIKSEILASDPNLIEEYIKQEKELKVYRHLFNDLFRTKKHKLTADKESLLAQATPALGAAREAYGFFANADLQFEAVEDENGKMIEVSHGRYTSALYSVDREYRKRVYKSFYKPFIQFKNTLAALFEGNIKGTIYTSRARNYSSTLEAALNPNNIPITVYENLVSSVEENLEPLHRWCSLKADVLKLDKLHPYDAYVTLFPSVKKEYTYDESIQILKDSLKPLGKEYLENLDLAFNNRWIDVFETKGKRSGAYSSGVTYGIHPYVLLNWNDQLNDVFTFTHEMGHNMHSYYTGQNQPYTYAGYSIFIAEIASTVNEALLLEYLIDRSESDEVKKSLIEKAINNIVTTYYRQTMFAAFEKEVHEKCEKGDAVTADYLTSLYSDKHMKYWGPSMYMDYEESYTWGRVPHFYYNFYVYQYATSFAASQILVKNFKNDLQNNVNKYLDLLKAGNSDYPINQLERAGINMLDQKPFDGVSNKMNELINQLEQLL
jgi:oligoendopeptidase F